MRYCLSSRDLIEEEFKTQKKKKTKGGKKETQKLKDDGLDNNESFASIPKIKE